METLHHVVVQVVLGMGRLQMAIHGLLVTGGFGGEVLYQTWPDTHPLYTGTNAAIKTDNHITNTQIMMKKREGVTHVSYPCNIKDRNADNQTDG